MDSRYLELRKASGVNEVRAAVAELKMADSVRAISTLAHFNRKTNGWLRIIVAGFVRVLLSIAWLLFVGVFIFELIRFCTLAILQFVTQTSTVGAWLLGLGCLFLITLPFTTSFNEIFKSFEERPVMQGNLLGKIFGRLAQGTALVLQATFLLLALVPTAYGIITIFDWLRAYSESADKWSDILLFEGVDLVLFGLIALLLISTIRVFSHLRQKQSARLFRSIGYLWIIGLWGVVITIFEGAVLFAPLPNVEQLVAALVTFDLWTAVEFQPIAVYWQPLFVFSFWLVLCLSYPLGMAKPIATRAGNMIIRCFNSFHFLINRLRMRFEIWQALKAQKKRNKEKIKGAAWSTVCNIHLNRFQYQSEKLKYGRWVTFACCPVCQDDVDALPNTLARAFRLDRTMQEEKTFENKTLYLNALHWMEEHDQPQGNLSLPVDSLIIGQVDPFDIEAFLTFYRGQDFTTPLRKLEGRILNEVTLDANSLSHMGSELSSVVDSFKLSDIPISHARRKRWQAKERRVRLRLTTALVSRMVLRACLMGVGCLLVFWWLQQAI